MAIHWQQWEALLQTRGVTLDRPRGSRHPRFPAMIYPLDYGYIPGTIGGDGAEVDVFVGTASTGLVGILQTHDARKGDDEIKLLWQMTPAEVEAVVAFLLQGDMHGTLVLRPHA